MAIVIDAARTGGGVGGEHNTDYQKGNDHPDTPTPTWLTFMTYNASVAETHVNFAYEAPIDNTGDTWVPIVEQTFLPSVPATVRF